MKKLTLTAALLAALALTACGNKTTEATPTPTPDLDAPATTPEEGMEIDPEFSVDPEEPAQAEPDAELSDMVDAIYKIQPVELTEHGAFRVQEQGVQQNAVDAHQHIFSFVDEVFQVVADFPGKVIGQG